MTQLIDSNATERQVSFFLQDDGDCIVEEKPNETLLVRKTLRPGQGRIVSGVTYETIAASGVTAGSIVRDERGQVSIRGQEIKAPACQL